MANSTESSDERSARSTVAISDVNGKSLSESDYEAFKIFAGGLNRITTADGLNDHFSKYGQVVHTEIVADKTTGKSRGFGFVTFASEDVVKKVLANTHRIDNVVVDVKQAVRKEKSKDLIASRDDTNRIFVGGISDTISDEHFREYFAKYGPIVSHNYLFDKATNKPRGFGFVIYENMDDSEKALGPHTSLGKNCEAKRAQPRPTPNSGNRISSSAPSAATTTAASNQEGFDYSAYYYAQPNMMYHPYFAQMYANNQMPPMSYFNQMAAAAAASGQMFPFVGANWNPEAAEQQTAAANDEEEEDGGGNKADQELYEQPSTSSGTGSGASHHHRSSSKRESDSRSSHGPTKSSSHRKSRTEPY